MKFAIVLTIAVVTIIVCVSADDATSISRLETLDIEQFAKNTKLRTTTQDCLLLKQTKGCPPEVKLLRELFEKYKEDCCIENCTETQIEKIKKVHAFYKENYPEFLVELQKVNDPTGELEAKCKKEHNVEK